MALLCLGEVADLNDADVRSHVQGVGGYADEVDGGVLMWAVRGWPSGAPYALPCSTKHQLRLILYSIGDQLGSNSLETLAQLFHGFSDRSRLSIVEALRGGERRVSDIVALTDLTQPNVSMHLSCLWECGLTAREKRGREVYYRLIPGIGELLGTADRILVETGETVGACPRYGSGRAAA